VTDQQEHWRDGEEARNYARWSGISAKLIHAPFARKIVASLPPMGPGSTIVDLGTGPGLLPLELHRLWPQAKIIGVDSSEEMIKIAKENAAKAGVSGFEARPGTAEELPLEVDSVDLVVTQSSFHEWENPRKALSEIYRALKPGGSLVLKDYNRAWLSPWKRKLLGSLHHLEMFKFTFEEVAHLLTEAGFREIRGRGKGLQLLVQGTK